ncbi:MAG: hypothetical protein WC449_05465 [Candidatus Paceibacterota bacterium]
MPTNWPIQDIPLELNREDGVHRMNLALFLIWTILGDLRTALDNYGMETIKEEYALGNWYNTEWKYRIRFDMPYNPPGGEPSITLPDFDDIAWTLEFSENWMPPPFWPNIDFHDLIQANGEDILFTASDGKTKLPHDIIYLNQGAAHMYQFVIRSPLTAANTFYMYFGNASCTTQINPHGVWPAGLYQGVWYTYTDGVSTTISDRSGNGNDIVEIGTSVYQLVGAKSAMQWNFAGPVANCFMRVAASSDFDVNEFTILVSADYTVGHNILFSRGDRGGVSPIHFIMEALQVGIGANTNSLICEDGVGEFSCTRINNSAPQFISQITAQLNGMVVNSYLDTQIVLPTTRRSVGWDTTASLYIGCLVDGGVRTRNCLNQIYRVIFCKKVYTHNVEWSALPTYSFLLDALLESGEIVARQGASGDPAILKYNCRGNYTHPVGPTPMINIESCPTLTTLSTPLPLATIGGVEEYGDLVKAIGSALQIQWQAVTEMLGEEPGMSGSSMNTEWEWPDVIREFNVHIHKFVSIMDYLQGFIDLIPGTTYDDRLHNYLERPGLCPNY